MATINSLITDMEKLREELHRLRTDVLPVKAGNLAVRHFKENFRVGGWQDGDIKPWAITWRQRYGGRDAASRFTPLLSRRARLMSATRFTPENGQVTVINDTPYARIHNEGGTVSQNITITPKFRKFAWAKFFEAGGGKSKEKGQDIPEAAKMWRGLALTKKTSIARTITIPKRQFMGKPRELVEDIRNLMKQEIERLLKK
jgi:phage gpG-like protein